MAVQLNGKWGFIDRYGKEVVPLKYQDVGGNFGFNEGLAAVEQNNKWGYVDKTGREVIPPQYEEAHAFIKGKAKVTLNGKELAISKPSISTTVKTQTENNNVTTVSKQEKANVTPPIAMKGIVDPSLVGTWKYYNAAMDPATYYVFKADGTYDYYPGFIEANNSMATKNCYWRIDGNYLETVCAGYQQAERYNILKRNDPATGKPALIIEFKGTAPNSRMYVAEDHNSPWKN